MPPHSVSFTNLSTTETPTTYTWHFGDGNTSNAPNTSHQYTSAGTFPITLEMETGGFCPQSGIGRPEVIEVLPVPQAAIDITPNQVDILNPQVWVEYLGDQDVDCYYNFGDGNGLEGCHVQYIYEDGGTYTITQTVVNDFGCAATATGEVSVAGSVFYAPTAFTPDGDGINDVWLPVVSGVTIPLAHHQPLGELVFESFDLTNLGWGNAATTGSTIARTACTSFTWPTSTKSGTHGRWRGHLTLAR